jgi:glycosyltransferase involved in cell wall biosynthesis
LRNENQLKTQIANGLRLSGVTIYTASQWGNQKKKITWRNYKKIPNDSCLKFAYHVTESTKIPKETVAIFNRHFDGVLIPDPWAVKVYKKSGVSIPVFALPLVLDLESLLNKPVKTKRLQRPFIFGFSAVDAPRKNHKLLIQAFSQEFGNNSDVQLCIHSRFNNKKGLNRIRRAIKNSGARNITLIQKAFYRDEYEDFISALSCYVILSKGEGFSITPREALAAGVPCVVSNNTAQKTICETGLVAAVPSTIRELAYNEEYRKKMGSMFNCTISDTRKALREVYQNYGVHLARAQKGREWTKQYLLENLKPKYENLVRPKKVILGRDNIITNDALMVNSPQLFDKYRALCGPLGTVFKQ